MNSNILLAQQQQGRRRYVDNYIVVYFDTFLSETTLTQFSQLGCLIESSTDPTEYIASISSFKPRRRICVISDRLAEPNILLLNNLPLVNTIYVISANETNLNFSTNKYPKIKGVYSDTMRIVEVLQRDIELVDRNFTPITIRPPDRSSEQRNTLNPMVMYYQLLKEIFLEMDYDAQAKQTLIDFCRHEYADNESGLDIINEFERDYEKRSPTWWYTRDSFVYRMLNKALRVYDIEVVNKFAFYINDLHRQLQELQSELPSTEFTVYRGQRLVHFSFND